MHGVWHFDRTDSATKYGASLYHIHSRPHGRTRTHIDRHPFATWCSIALITVALFVAAFDRTASYSEKRDIITQNTDAAMEIPKQTTLPSLPVNDNRLSVSVTHESSSTTDTQPSSPPSDTTATVTINGQTTILPPNTLYHEEVPGESDNSSIHVTVDSTAAESTSDSSSKLRVRTKSSSSSSISSTQSSTFTSR